MEDNVRRKIALITGASGEIGGAIVRRFVRDGFAVVIHYNKGKKNAEALSRYALENGGEAFLVKADITNEKEIKNMFGLIRKKFGALDILINCAGLNNSDERLSHITPDKFKQIIDVNLYGVAMITKIFLPLIKKSSSGRIIFVSSILAFSGSARRPAYAAAKGGIIGLAKSLALDLAPKILVNTVVPSYIDTKMIRQSKTETVGKRIMRIPLKRLGTTDEVAGLVSFLCSDDARYIHGQSIHVNGGVYFS